MDVQLTIDGLTKGGPGARSIGGLLFKFFCPQNIVISKKKLSLSIEYIIPTFVLKLKCRQGGYHGSTMKNKAKAGHFLTFVGGELRLFFCLHRTNATDALKHCMPTVSLLLQAHFIKSPLNVQYRNLRFALDVNLIAVFD